MITDGLGNPIASADGPIRYFRPEGTSELTLEFHPQELLNAAGLLAARCLKQAGARAGEVKAVSVASQRHGVVFLDRKGEELLVSPNVDTRAAFEGAAIDEELGPDIYRRAGQSRGLLLAPSRLRWLENNRPDSFQRLDSILTVGGWLAYQLTGQRACEPSLAAGVGLLNVNEGGRDGPLLEKLGVPESLLPPLSTAGEIVGTLTPDLAAGWGLDPGVPVTLAGADTQCGLLGMGLGRPGDTGVVAGWSCAMQMVTPRPCYDDASRAWVSPIPLRAAWVSEANLGDAGNAHRWLTEGFLHRDSATEERDAGAAAVPPGSDGVISYLGTAPTAAAEAGLRRGGILFPTPLQYQTPTPARTLRAFWESLAYALKSNLAAIERAAGRNAEALCLGGGMSRSRLLAKITASVLNREARRSLIPQASARGAALAAGVAAGLLDGSQPLTPMWEGVEPDPAEALEYRELYHQWKGLYHRLQEGDSDLY